MNRILQADVILTLTREQADVLAGLLIGGDFSDVWRPLDDVEECLQVLGRQLHQQGVQL